MDFKTMQFDINLIFLCRT